MEEAIKSADESGFTDEFIEPCIIKSENTRADIIENDDVVKSALPDEMLKVFMHYKRDEWEKFLSAVTQWDVDTYLDILP